VSEKSPGYAASRVEAVFRAIVEHLAEHEYPPTLRELMTATGISSTSVMSGYLRRLEAAGRIRRERGSPRAIRVLAP